MLSYHELAKISGRRQEAGRRVLGILPNIILCATVNPNKWILRAGAIQSWHRAGIGQNLRKPRKMLAELKYCPEFSARLVSLSGPKGELCP